MIPQLNKKNNFFIFFLSIFLLITPAESRTKVEKFCTQADMNNKNFCPKNFKVGHKLIMVDFTSRWEKAQIDWIKQRIFGSAIINNTPPFYKISYLPITDIAPQSQEIIYAKCRYKTGEKSEKFPGEEVNKKCEGADFVKGTVYKAWLEQFTKLEKNFFSNQMSKTAERSLIYEYIVHVLRESAVDFTDDYPVRELVIVSDLMQFSKRMNFYKHCKSIPTLKKADKCGEFSKLLKKKNVKNYIDDRKPVYLKNLKVTVLYINHAYQTKQGLSTSLGEMWKELFKYMGIQDVTIVKQLDIP